MFKGGPSFFRSSLALSLAAALGACHDPAPHGGPGAPDLAAPILPDAATPDLGAGTDLPLPPAEGRPLFARGFRGDVVSPERVAAGADGAIAVGGRFRTRADFGTGEITAANNLDQSFVVRLGPDGTTRWARAFLGPARNLVTGVAVDAAGAVLVTGQYRDAIDLGTGQLPGSPGALSIYVVKYTADGQLAWTRTYRSATGSDTRPLDVTADADGSVLLSGELGTRVDFGGGELDTGGVTAPFLLKLTPGGAHVFSRLVSKPGVAGLDARQLRATPGGEVVVAGDVYTSGTSVDLGDGPRAVPDHARQAFFVRYGADGTFKQARLIDRGGRGSVLGTALAVTRSGELLIGGAFEKTLDCDGTPVTAPGTGSGSYLARFGATGDILWCHSYGDAAGTVRIDSLDLDAHGDAVAFGTFSGAMNLDGVAVRTQGLATELFALKLGARRQPLWVRTYGNPTDHDYPGRVAIDGEDRAVLVGAYTGSIDLGGTVLTSGQNGAGLGGFVLKLSR